MFDLNQPAIIAAFVASAVSLLLGVYIHHGRLAAEQHLAAQRFENDRRLQEEKAEADRSLAERKFEFDKALSEQKAKIDHASRLWQIRSAFAEEALVDFYEADGKVRHIRSRTVWASEEKSRRNADVFEPETLRNRRDTYFRTLSRLYEHQEFFNSVLPKRFKATALFGSSAIIPYVQLQEIIVEIGLAAETLVNNTSFEPSDANLKEMLEASIWLGSSDSDRLAEEMKSVIAGAEQLFSPVLKAPSPLA